MKLSQLTACLDELGWSYACMTRCGGVVVALQRGARIIGVFPDESGDNALWVNPVIANPHDARKLFDESNFWNMGGERVWFSPELEFHVASPVQPVDYRVQTTIDPGCYEWKSQAVEQCSWYQQGIARAFRQNGNVAFELNRSCRMLSDPLHQLTQYEENRPGYSYVGYEMKHELNLNQHIDPTVSTNIATWSIVQVPAGGEALIPVYGRVIPTDFFAPTGSQHLTVTEGLVRFRIDGLQSHKISFKSAQITGRFGYYRNCGKDKSQLIIRQIQPNPAAAYSDVPWQQPNDSGHCLQVYNDDGAIGHFGELEHHSPSIDCKSGYPVMDQAQLWCYSGTTAQITEISRLLLGFS